MSPHGSSLTCMYVLGLSGFLPVTSHNITPQPQLQRRHQSVPRKHDPVYNLTIIRTPTVCDARLMIYPTVRACECVFLTDGFMRPYCKSVRN